MNTKNIILVASILAIFGLLAGVIFNLIDLATFGLATASVLGILYGLYEKFENKELKSEIDSLSLQLVDSDKQIRTYHEKLTKEEKLNQLSNKIIKSLNEEIEATTQINSSLVEDLNSKKDTINMMESIVEANNHKLKVTELPQAREVSLLLEDTKGEIPKIKKRRYNKNKNI